MLPEIGLCGLQFVDVGQTGDLVDIKEEYNSPENIVPFNGRTINVLGAIRSAKAPFEIT